MTLEELADSTIQRLAEAIMAAERSLLGNVRSLNDAADNDIVDIDSALGRQYCLPVIRQALKLAKSCN